MNEFKRLIEQAYELAKMNHWDELLEEWRISRILANRCSRFIESETYWTFLHQAAYFGNEEVCQYLISLGASIDVINNESYTPVDIAEQRGYSNLAILLKKASMAGDSLWSPSSDPDVLPSSNRWSEAIESIAVSEMFVGYGGGLVRINKGKPYYKDSFNRILVGWHGTFNPPSGMDGQSMIANRL